MKLHKLTMALAVCGLMSLSGINVANAAPGTGIDYGTIDFNGEVTTSTCDVSVSSPNGADGNQATVNLEKVSASSITSQDGGAHSFTINVSGCDTASTDAIGVTFAAGDGLGPTPDGTLPNTSTDKDTVKVSLALYDNGSMINLTNADQTKGSKFQLDADGAGHLDYVVMYHNDVNGTTPAAGLVKSSATYQLNYQ